MAPAKETLVAVVAAGLLLSGSAEAASFNCRYANSPTEVLICKDKELSDLDEINATVFYTIRDNLSAAGPEALHSQGARLAQTPECLRLLAGMRGYCL